MITTSQNRRLGSGLVLPLFLLGLACLSLGGFTALPAHAQTSSTVLQGYVFNYDGKFVPGATITLYTEPAHAPAGPTTTSNAKGEWSMDTGTGTFAVRAEAPGYQYAEQTVYATSYQTGITFILRDQARQDQFPLVSTIAGKVTSLDNVPLGGMNIIATNARDTGVQQIAPPPTLNVAVTDANGNYSIRVPAGTIWLTLKTGAVWGYQRNPVNVTAGETMGAADFVAAIRVLPRTSFPTATPVVVQPTATPIQNVLPSVGMPATGAGGGDALPLLLAAFGLLCVAAGGLLALRARSVRS